MRSRFRSASIAVALAVVLSGVASWQPSRSSAHDALMGDMAKHPALPDEPWVMRHWVPFDEQQLADLLKLRRGQLEAFLYDDHHTIAQLISRRRLNFDRVVAKLTAWAPAETKALVVDRTRQTLVGGHLAQHLLFHVFHGDLEYGVAAEQSGATSEAFAQLYLRDGYSIADIAFANGKNAVEAREAVKSALITDLNQARDAGFIPPVQADRMILRKGNRLQCWLVRPYQPLDSTSPYGRRFLWHRHHSARTIPKTMKQQAKDEKFIESRRKRLKPSCWPVPAKWKGNAGKPLSRKKLRGLAGYPNGWSGPVEGTM